MFCPKCGALLDDGVKFCTECGYRMPVGRTETPPAAAQQAPISKAPQQFLPQQVEAAAPVKKSKKGLVAAIVAVAAAAVVALALALLGVFSPKNVYSFGSSEAVAVEATTPIVPSATADSPLTHYYVRICEAEATDGSVIDVLGWPRLEVSSDEGFSLGDFVDEASDLPDGTYQAVVTSDDGADQVLPPLAVGEAASAAEGAESAGNMPSIPDQVIVAPASSGFLGLGGSSEDSEQPAKQGRYAAFLAVLNDLKATVGEPNVLGEHVSNQHVDYWAAALQGACFARLVDFGDGEQRLVACYCTETLESADDVFKSDEPYWVSVYEYDEESDSAEIVRSVSVPVTMTGEYYLMLSQGSDGKSYVSLSGGNGRFSYFYGLCEDGTIGQVAEIARDYGLSGDVLKVNGEECDSDAWNAAWELTRPLACLCASRRRGRARTTS